MNRITIILNHKPDTLENDSANEAMLGLKETFKEVLARFDSRLQNENATVCVRIDDVDKIKIETEGASKQLHEAIEKAILQ